MKFFKNYLCLGLISLILGFFTLSADQLVQPLFTNSAAKIAIQFIKTEACPGIQTQDGFNCFTSLLLNPAENIDNLQARKNSVKHFAQMENPKLEQLKSDIKELSEIVSNSTSTQQLLNDILVTTQDLMQKKDSTGKNSELIEAVKIAEQDIAGSKLQIFKRLLSNKWNGVKSFFKNFREVITNDKIKFKDKGILISSKITPLLLAIIFPIFAIFSWIQGLESVIHSAATGCAAAAACIFSSPIMIYFLIAATISILTAYGIYKVMGMSQGQILLMIMSLVIAPIFNLPAKLVNMFGGSAYLGTNLTAGLYTVGTVASLAPLFKVQKAVTLCGRMILENGSSGITNIFQAKNVNSLIGGMDAFTSVASVIKKSASDENFLPISIPENNNANVIDLKNAWDIVENKNDAPKDVKFTGTLTNGLVAQLMLYNGLGVICGTSDSQVKFINFNDALIFSATGVPHVINSKLFGIVA